MADDTRHMTRNYSLFHFSLWNQSLHTGTIPGDLLTETILTVGDVIWGQPASQQELASSVMPGTGAERRTAVETLLICMLNDKQVILYAFLLLTCVSILHSSRR